MGMHRRQSAYHPAARATEDGATSAAAGRNSAGRATEVDGLARTYAQTRHPQVRETLVRQCSGLVYGIAAEYRQGVPDEDLVQVGYLGLLHAIDRYDPAQGAPFLVFARHLVRGEIRHYLRDHSHLLRRPRWLDRANTQVEQAVDDHVSEHGRYPGLADLAARVDLDADSLSEILKTREVVRTLSLDTEDEDGQPKVDPGHLADPGARWPFPVEDRLILIEALERLNPLQRTVVFHLFFTDLTQVEAAARIGISQKHVSRVLASALHRLHEVLAPRPVGD